VREERLLSRLVRVPRIRLGRAPVRQHVTGGLAAQHLRPQWREDHTPLGIDPSDGGGERITRRDGIEPGDACGGVADVQVRADRTLARGRPRNQEQRAAARAAVEHKHRSGFDDPRQIEELVALPER